MEKDQERDIAVIGLGCRVAGNINTPEDLWQFLLSKGDASSEIPPMRWEPYRNQNARTDKALRGLPTRGYVLHDLEAFDASFFGTSGREAELMDPQQRISIEVAWEALEDAGIPPQSLAGSDTGVYMGVGSDDYSRLLFEDLPGIEGWSGIGTAYCGVPNRISYLLDLSGPSFAVDAACASSLVAIHHARQALLAGETSLAIAGGVNALIIPSQVQMLSHAGVISTDGRCRSFDDAASGYGRGEGVGIVVLKRLSDAVRDQDRIYAVLKGSAIAHDGRTNGIMAPNQISQAKVAREALEAARVNANSVLYVEAHATSTPVGDPVEISAISNVYGNRKPGAPPCYLGSIKPNIGHLEAGAGALGFIKAVLVLQNQTIPPQTNLTTLNRKIDWQASGLEVVRDRKEWSNCDQPQRAAVCAYGYGGTVSHAILESTASNRPSEDGPSCQGRQSEPALLLISAPQQSRIGSTASHLADWLTSSGSSVGLSSVATTLGVRRGHHPYRVAAVASHAEEAAKLLRGLGDGAIDSESVVSAKVSTAAVSHGAVWVFSGHGAHWKGMGLELLEHDEVFAEVIRTVDTVAQDELGFSVEAALRDGELESTDQIHVLTFAMHVGLSAVLKSKGVVPQAVIGHSLGEVAAAVCVESLSLYEGALIVCKKAKLLRDVMGTGSMLLLQIPFAEAMKDIGSTQGISVAIDSSPTSCVVSGKIDVVERLKTIWIERGIPLRSVKSDIAFHSPVLNPLGNEYKSQLEGQLDPQSPSIPLYSTSIPSDPRSQACRDADYWVNSMTGPVFLTSAIKAAAEDGYGVFMEVSSHPIVCQSIEETLQEYGHSEAVVYPTLLRNRPTRRSILLSIGRLHCSGVAVDFRSTFPGQWTDKVPKTKWKHQAFWKKIVVGSSKSQETHNPSSNTLLGHRTKIFVTDITMWQTSLDDSVKPYPNLHPILGTEIIPAAVLLNTFLRAGGGLSVANIALKVPVAVMPARDIQVCLRKDHIILSSRLIDPDSTSNTAQSWLTHTTGRILNNASIHCAMGRIDVQEIRNRTEEKLKPSFAIDYLASLGVTDMGFPWLVTEHLSSNNEMLACVDIAPGIEDLPWDANSLAPFLDAATSIGASLFHAHPEIRMPSHIDQLSTREGGPVPKQGFIHAKRAQTAWSVDIAMADLEGNIFAQVKGMTLAELDGNDGVGSSMGSLVHQLAWPAAPIADFPREIRHIIFVGPPGDLTQAYQNTLRATTNIRLSIVDEPKLIPSVDYTEDDVVIFIPGQVDSIDQVPEHASDSCAMLVDTVKVIATLSPAMKLYCITSGATSGCNPSALAHGALLGLSRIIEAEHSNIWGGLLDVQDSTFPLQALKYVGSADVIKIVDGIARINRLRPLPREKLWKSNSQPRYFPTVEGTYLITGGIGDLGLEVASWLIEKGARRLVLVSRRVLPPRHSWKAQHNKITNKLMEFERDGVTVHVVSIDVAAPEAALELHSALDRLSLPPVRGVVHAAGILEGQFIMSSTRDSFDRVIAPKIKGAMVLDKLFPPQSLDFFVLFSSCAPLFQFTGSASYAAGNSFLDSLAKRRRDLGDNAISFQWTCWRDLGMAADADNPLNAEMEIRGITDITREDAFRAWEHLAHYDLESAVVVRARPISRDSILASPILADIVIRHSNSEAKVDTTLSKNVPATGPQLTSYLATVISDCVAHTLTIRVEDIDPTVALSEMGLDSVMTMQLRKHLQDKLQIKVPPTLLWAHPSVAHMVKWFQKEIEERE